MELIKQIPSQLIWSLITCCLLFVAYFSLELDSFYERNSVDSVDSGLEIFGLSPIGNNQEMTQSEQMLSRMIGIRMGKHVNLTHDEIQILTSYIRNHVLISPNRPRTRRPCPTSTKPSLEDLKQVRSTKCDIVDPLQKKLSELVREMRNGFYVESRARNGTSLSSFTSAILENELNFTGLIVEGVPALQTRLILQNRNAWIAKACLSANSTEHMEYFQSKNRNSRPPMKLHAPTKLELDKKLAGNSSRIIECFQLEHILAAINVQSIDVLLLDLDGQEYAILNRIPESIPIKIIVLQHWLVPEGRDAFKGLMYARQYFMTFETESAYIFIQKKVLLGPILRDYNATSEN